jgi:hypothetical protein
MSIKIKTGFFIQIDKLRFRIHMEMQRIRIAKPRWTMPLHKCKLLMRGRISKSEKEFFFK